MIVAVGGCYAMELHSILRRNIAHMSTIIRSFAGCRSFRDVREGADVGRYQLCAANVASVALPAAAAKKCASAFELNRYSDAMNHETRTADAMNDPTRADRARRGKRSWRIPTASVASAAKQANEWHRWYAWHPVICDNASGGVAWGSTLLRRSKRGQWVYRMRLRNRDIQRHY
jgi:hypothetical protein